MGIRPLDPLHVRTAAGCWGQRAGGACPSATSGFVGHGLYASVSLGQGCPSRVEGLSLK